MSQSANVKIIIKQTIILIIVNATTSLFLFYLNVIQVVLLYQTHLQDSAISKHIILDIFVLKVCMRVPYISKVVGR